MPDEDEIPSTIQRSPQKAKETWSAAYDSADEQYDEAERVRRTAFAALKHSFEKIGDHWEPKDQKGPSDRQSERSGAAARRGGPTAEGVDANASKAHLMDVARRLEVPGRSSMNKAELVEAIKRANRRATRQARS